MGGHHKALLPIGGEKLIQRQIRLMAPICTEIIVVTNDPELFAPYVDRFVRIVADFYPGNGPLAGMHAALSGAGNEYAWVVGCDMPFLSADAASHMMNKLQRMELDAVVPRLDGRLHPLHAVYRSACAKPIEELLEAGTYRVMELFGKIRWESLLDEEFAGLGIELRFAVNTNTPEEWAEALRMEGGEDDARQSEE